jgi:hypothetical protein
MLLCPNLNLLPSWAVILPREVGNPTRPVKLELAIYPDLQVWKFRWAAALFWAIFIASSVDLCYRVSVISNILFL